MGAVFKEALQMSTIFGIGTDIIHIPRVEKLIQDHGEHFSEKILTLAELSQFRSVPPLNPAKFLAKRFAVKEATVKALGTGFRQGISLRQIGLSHDDLGKPLIMLEPALLKRVQQAQIKELQVTTSDEKEYVVAFVMALR